MLWEIIVGVLAGVIVFAVTVGYIVNKKKGKTSCGCGDCNGCCSCCTSKKTETK